MLTSATGEETLTLNSNDCNSTLTSGTRSIYPHRYILMLISGVTAYVFSMRGVVLLKVNGIQPLAPVQNSVALKLMQSKTLNFVISLPDVENITK